MSPRNRASLATAKAVPPFLVLLVGYASYVIIGPLSIDYLINPPSGTPTQIPAGIAIPIVYCFLLIIVGIAWLRLLLVVWLDPGYVPQGSERPPSAGFEQDIPPGLDEFWMRDVFVCDKNGLPIWCDYCNNWKPDRTHHNQDTGRCTRKMDHFCPWVGGVVGERSMKFFIQFLFYTMVFTAYLTGVFAYYVAKYKKDVQWIVVLAVAGFFLLFTSGMVMNSVHLVLSNTTTIENAGAGGRRTYLCVLLPPELQADSPPPPPPAALLHSTSDTDSNHPDSNHPLTSELDDPSHLSYFSRPSRPARRVLKYSSTIWKGTITYPLSLPVDKPPLPAPTLRKFAILEVPLGVNPWDLGRPLRNFQAVFGSGLHEWLIPYKHSPCCNHTSAISEFPLGPQFEQLLRESRITQPRTPLSKEGRSSAGSHKRKRVLDPGWQNGERPDAWITEKENRRMRKEQRRRMREEEENNFGPS